MNQVLIESSWHSLEEWMLAAYQGDARRFLDIARGFEGRLTLREQHALSIYIYFLLQFSVILRTGHKPTPEELRRLAESVHPKVATIVSVDPYAVERALQMALEMAMPGDALAPKLFAPTGSATLGALLTDPDTELPKWKESLERMWKANLETITELIGED